MTVKRPSHQEISARAYQLYLERGRQSAYELDDWLQAEYELMQLPLAEIAKLEPAPVPAKKSAPAKQLVEVVRAAMML